MRGRKKSSPVAPEIAVDDAVEQIRVFQLQVRLMKDQVREKDSEIAELRNDLDEWKRKAFNVVEDAGGKFKDKVLSSPEYMSLQSKYSRLEDDLRNASDKVKNLEQHIKEKRLLDEKRREQERMAFEERSAAWKQREEELLQEIADSKLISHRISVDASSITFSVEEMREKEEQISDLMSQLERRSKELNSLRVGNESLEASAVENVRMLDHMKKRVKDQDGIIKAQQRRMSELERQLTALPSLPISHDDDEGPPGEGAASAMGGGVGAASANPFGGVTPRTPKGLDQGQPLGRGLGDAHRSSTSSVDVSDFVLIGASADTHELASSDGVTPSLVRPPARSDLPNDGDPFTSVGGGAAALGRGGSEDHGGRERASSLVKHDRKLHAKFSLPATERALYYFSGAYHGKVGYLWITDSFLCFDPSLSSKEEHRFAISISSISHINKVKGHDWIPGKGASATIVLKDGTEYALESFFKRKEAVAAIVHQAESLGGVISVLRDGKIDSYVEKSSRE